MNLALLRQAIPLWTMAPIGAPSELLFDGHALPSIGARLAGEPVTGKDSEARALRDELLTRSKAGEHIELQLSCTPFVQHPTEPNRNFIRFRDGSLSALGKSGVNTVFLRDHSQRDLDMRGGTVTRSTMKRDPDKLHHLRQVVLLHEPWAVQKALTGSIDRFSIGWNPTGPVLCSACNTKILSECWHWPGDNVELDGVAQVIEWVFQAAELLETSAVCVPAVRYTTVDDIRAALSGHTQTPGPARIANITPPRPGRAPTHPTQRTTPMPYTRLNGRLGLAENADEDAALAVLDKREQDSTARLAAAAAQLEQANEALMSERATHEALKASLADQELSAFIQSGVEQGKVRPGSKFEAALRTLYNVDPAAAREQLESAPRLTPVGTPRQSDAPDVPESGPDALTHEQLKNAGIADPAAYYAKYKPKD